MLGLAKLPTHPPLMGPYPDSLAEKTHMVGGRWPRLCQFKYLSLIAVVVGFTLFLSSVFVNEQSSTRSLMETFTSPFKVDNCTAPLKVENCTSPFKDTKECFLTRTHCTRGGDALPKGIIVATTDLQLRSLATQSEAEIQRKATKNLLAMAVGIKQKKEVDEIVRKFPLRNFTIMLFHYDGVVDQWYDLPWSNTTIHIVALHQTKWWFAKRFMHPDIVAQYNYIFLWDEDLGVKNFHADNYLKIMEEEGMEISQPALDPASHDIHHGITVRKSSQKAHKRFMKKRGSTSCSKDSNGPPCTGWVEVMAPVFSRAAWRCTWYLIQNDLVHGWGIDFKIGYCSQGVRSEKVGVIDAEYILHKGIPSLGGPHVSVKAAQEAMRDARRHRTDSSLNNSRKSPSPSVYDLRTEVRRRSGNEMGQFLKRWRDAVKADPTWIDPYKHLNDSSGGYHAR